jgi:hypothetical protein
MSPASGKSYETIVGQSADFTFNIDFQRLLIEAAKKASDC